MAKAARTQDKVTQREQQRELQRRRELARQRARSRQRWMWVASLAAGVIALAAAILFAVHQSGGSTGTAVAASLGPPTNDLPGSATGNFTAIKTTVRSGSGKPEVLFVGTQSCSFCAAERWAVVKSLGQFGAWSNLHRATKGGNTANYTSIPTFDLIGAGYSSPYVAFASKDTADYNGNPLENLTANEQALFNRYDPQGGTPMVLVADYVMIGSGYSPGDIDGQPFNTIQTALQQHRSGGYVREINAEANVITAILCRADGMKPQAVCGRSAIQAATTKIR